MRIFFAIDLANHPILKKPLISLPDIRWSKPWHLHVTLQFLKDVQIHDVAAISHHVKNNLQEQPSFQLDFGNLELFPSAEHPSVLSIQVGPFDVLAHLAFLIGQGIVASEYEIEKRPFRPHLTLARIQHPFVLPKLSVKPLLIREITLFESKPSQQGSHYIPLTKFPLKS